MRKLISSLLAGVLAVSCMPAPALAEGASAVATAEPQAQKASALELQEPLEAAAQESTDAAALTTQEVGGPNFVIQSEDNRIAHLNANYFTVGMQPELTLDIEDPDGPLTIKDAYTIDVDPASDAARSKTPTYWLWGTWGYATPPGKKYQIPVEASAYGARKQTHWTVGMIIEDPMGFQTFIVDEAYANNINSHSDSCAEAKSFVTTGSQFVNPPGSERPQIKASLYDLSNLWTTLDIPMKEGVVKKAPTDLVLTNGKSQLGLGDISIPKVTTSQTTIAGGSFTYLKVNPAELTSAQLQGDNGHIGALQYHGRGYGSFAENSNESVNVNIVNAGHPDASAWAYMLSIRDSNNFYYTYIDSTYAAKVRAAGDQADDTHKNILKSGMEFIPPQMTDFTAPIEIDMSNIHFSVSGVPSVDGNPPGKASLELTRAVLNKENCGAGDTPSATVEFNRSIDADEYSGVSPIEVSINPNSITAQNIDSVRFRPEFNPAATPTSASDYFLKEKKPLGPGRTGSEGWIIGISVTDKWGFKKVFLDSTFKSKVESILGGLEANQLNSDAKQSLYNLVRYGTTSGYVDTFGGSQLVTPVATTVLNGGLHYKISATPGIYDDPNPPTISLNTSKMNFAAVGPGNAARLELDIADGAGIKKVTPTVITKDPATLTTQMTAQEVAAISIQEEATVLEDDTRAPVLTAQAEGSTFTTQAGKFEVTLEKVNRGSEVGKRWLVALEVEDNSGFKTKFVDSTYAAKTGDTTSTRLDLSSVTYEVTSDPADGYDPARSIRKVDSTNAGAGAGSGAGAGGAGGAGGNVFRLYNRWSGEHFYTADSGEFDALVALGWNDEGVAAKSPAEGSPVYRLYNKWTGDHHFTMSADERDACVAAGWKDEGVAFNSAGSDGTPVYRLYNPYAKAAYHHFTADGAERDYLKSIGWRDEEIGWYGA